MAGCAAIADKFLADDDDAGAGREAGYPDAIDRIADHLDFDKAGNSVHRKPDTQPAVIVERQGGLRDFMGDLGGQVDAELGGHAVADATVIIGQDRLDLIGAGLRVRDPADEGNGAGDNTAVDQPGGGFLAQFDLIDLLFGDEAQNLDGAEVDHRGAGIARAEARADLGGVGFQQAVEGRADHQAVDVELDQVHLGLRRLELGLAGGSGGLGGETLAAEGGGGIGFDQRLGQPRLGFQKLGRAGAGIETAENVMLGDGGALAQRLRDHQAGGLGGDRDVANGDRAPAQDKLVDRGLGAAVEYHYRNR